MKPTPDDSFHLSVEIVEEIHAEAIAEFGRSTGIRDLTLLESAVSAPQATVGGKSPYADLIEMGGAYLFCRCRKHPFVDGTKRTALAACLVYLQLNGLELSPDGPEWENLVLAVAAGKMGRDELTARLRLLVG